MEKKSGEYVNNHRANMKVIKKKTDKREERVER